jgi:hypothetical protein
MESLEVLQKQPTFMRFLAPSGLRKLCLATDDNFLIPYSRSGAFLQNQRKATNGRFSSVPLKIPTSRSCLCFGSRISNIGVC